MTNPKPNDSPNSERDRWVNVTEVIRVLKARLVAAEREIEKLKKTDTPQPDAPFSGAAMTQQDEREAWARKVHDVLLASGMPHFEPTCTHVADLILKKEREARRVQEIVTLKSILAAIEQCPFENALDAIVMMITGRLEHIAELEKKNGE